MPSKKTSVKKPPVVDEMPADEIAEADVESDKQSPVLDKVAIAKKRYQPRFPNPWGQHKANKIGNAPRGTRKSMGKR